MSGSGGGTSATSLAKGALAVAALVGCLGVGNRLSARVAPALEASAGMSVEQQVKLEEVAAASLFGQFRSSMADFLWIKVDKYLHNGVDLRGTTKAEKERQAADQVRSARGEVARAHVGEETTVVPSARRDWRGRLGHLERQIKPYQDMGNHTHKDPKEALPLFRLMTWSNPRFVPAYTNGAMLIAQDPKKLEEAVAFLREGEKANPQSIEILNALGHLLTARLRRFPEGLVPLQKAIALGKARDLATLTDDEKGAFQDAYRWLVLNRREAGDPDGAIAVAREGLARFPDDVVCKGHLRLFDRPGKAKK